MMALLAVASGTLAADSDRMKFRQFGVGSPLPLFPSASNSDWHFSRTFILMFDY